MSNTIKYKRKPMMLYVNQVLETGREHIDIAQEMIIDIQMTEQDARELKEMLIRKLSVEVFGTIGFRLKGRLTL